MTTEELICIVLFAILLLAINFVHFFINKALTEKPPGSRTVYDQALLDLFFLVKLFGSYVSIVFCVSKVHLAKTFLQGHRDLLTLACSLYSFGFTCFSTSAVITCIVRDVSISKMSFLEETI